MIIRPNQNWFFRLFAWHGSVLSKITFRLSLNILMSVVAIISYQWYEQLGIHLTVAPFSLLGIAIAIFLGFRNSAGYGRFVEARNLWGSLLITVRTLLRQIKSLLPDDRAVHQKIAHLLIAFSWSLKHQLRNTDPTADLYHNLSLKELPEVTTSPMPTNRILLLLGQEIGKLRQQGLLSDITFEMIDNKLSELSHVLGGCERLSNTPVPFAYTLILQRTVYLFCSLLPFALVADLHYMTPFVSVFISYTFLSWDSLAEELEDPFGTSANDLPLNAICNTIERSLLEMNDQTPLPPPLKPDAHFNLI
ncbi:Predicted membrane protein [Serratia entomophila]|uniref:bestrophin family protein n=1 Tax=Serratia entomophila TaxID=42906 RepID=UPI002177D135|nr:bestrophin family ion channel [Serratia entomophila]CAI0744622.1 Predicted membrane protein [Serratia entomophila]CAI1582785.1 Predicted membrane protein [Serratia entomophila]CAI1596445.1 Predicted membrane protein [Serratia entomophila]CAI1601328.1 Predicted membrane protein [Serratia entomophila]CAI1958970.1 Predicted membrane protein [Serratia entomophila]